MADEKTNKTSTATIQATDTSAAPESEGSARLTSDPSDKGGPASSSPESGGSTEGSGGQSKTGSQTKSNTSPSKRQ